MRSAIDQLSSGPASGPFARPDAAPRRRVSALALTIVAHVLLLLLLLKLAPPLSTPPKVVPRLILIPMSQAAQAAHTRTKSSHASGGAPAHAPVPTRTRSTTAPVPPPTPATSALQMLTLNHDEFAASDIGAMPSHKGEGSAAGDGSGAGNDSSTDGAGTGPHGEQLYNVEWYRRPTDAELSTYMPKHSVEAGWGEVACRTIERFHVDDCVELGESPPGSGLSRAVRQAAWQFLVRPPRVGGRSLVGSWVRIHIDFSEYRIR